MHSSIEMFSFLFNSFLNLDYFLQQHRSNTETCLLCSVAHSQRAIPVHIVQIAQYMMLPHINFSPVVRIIHIEPFIFIGKHSFENAHSYSRFLVSMSVYLSACVVASFVCVCACVCILHRVCAPLFCKCRKLMRFHKFCWSLAMRSPYRDKLKHPETKQQKNAWKI